MISPSRRRCVVGLGLVGLCLVGCGPAPAPEPSAAARFTTILAGLMADTENAAASVAPLRGGETPGVAAFVALGRLRDRMRRSGPGEPSVAIWSLDGTPLAWAGSMVPSRGDEFAGGARFAVFTRAGRTWFLSRIEQTRRVIIAARSFGPESAWSPANGEGGIRFATRPVDAPPATSGRQTSPAPATDLIDPDGRRLAVLVSSRGIHAPVSGSGQRHLLMGLVMLAGLFAAARLARRPDGTCRLLVPVLAVAGARAVTLGMGGMSMDTLGGAALQGSRILFGLFRSPLDTVETGATLLALAAITMARVAAEHRRSRSRQGAWRHVAGLLAAGIITIGAGYLVFHVAVGSQMNLLATARDDVLLPRLAVQIGLLCVLWAPGLGLAHQVSRLGSRPVVAATVALLGAAVGFFALATLARGVAREELIEHNLRPELLAHESDRLQALTLSRRQIMAGRDLPERLTRAFRSGHEDDLAWQLWAGTEMAREGYRSSLEVYDADGHLRGAFGIEMPPPVAIDDHPADNLVAVDVATVVFSTLSQEAPVFTSRWPVRAGQEIVGAVALYVSNEVDNLPALLADHSPWTRAVPGLQWPGVTEQLGGPVLALVRDRDNRLLWSAHADPPPVPPGFSAASVPSLGVWRHALSGHHPVRLLYFGDGHRLFALGFHHDSVLDHAGGLFRLVPFLLAVGGLAIGLALLGSRGIRFLTVRSRELARQVGGSFAGKLVVATLLASLLPLLILALVLRGSLATQRRENLNELGIQSLGVAERVVRDALVAAGSQTPDIVPTDETLFWISRVIRQEIDLFVNGRLAATSRRGLYAAGLISPVVDADVYRRIVLEQGQNVLSPAPRFDPAAAIISGRVDLGAVEPAILSLSLDLQQADIDRRLRRVRELTDLATIAVALLVVGAAIAVGRGMSARLKTLTAATEGLAGGEEGTRVADRSADEVGRLTRSFNFMATTLGEQRAVLRRRTRTLEQILLHAPTGIVSLDGEGRVSTANPAATGILHTARPLTAGDLFRRVVAGSPYERGVATLLDMSGGDASTVSDVSLAPDEGGEERLRAIVAPLPVPAGGRLLILEDITQTVRSHQLAAWAEMARSIAHEIKNPLTPIRLSAEHLLRLHEANDPALGEALVSTVKTILRQVDTLREIASDFSLYARIPALVRRPVDVTKLVNGIMEPYRHSPPRGTDVQVNVADGLPVLELDERLVERALVNMVENGLQAMPDGGTLSVTAVRRAQSSGGGVKIEVADTGLGMDPQTVDRLFEPYFSTRETGTGLGLPIARRAIESHGGRITVRSVPGRGTTFVIDLPLSATPPAASDTSLSPEDRT
ncbi:MAG: ATP-binding protein [Acidobacteriota bacterium]